MLILRAELAFKVFMFTSHRCTRPDLRRPSFLRTLVGLACLREESVRDACVSLGLSK